MGMKKKIGTWLMAVAMCSIAVAGPDWNDSAGDHLWTNGANWTGGNAPGTGGADNNPAIHGQANGPIIDTAVSYQWVVYHGVFGTQPGAVIITTTNASLTCFTYILGSQNDTYNDAVISMDGGVLHADTFKLGDSQSGRVDISGGIISVYNSGNQLLVGASGDWSRGKLNITGTGDVRADTLVMNTSPYQQDSRILINDSGVLKVRGDQTGAGTDLMTYIDNGWIYTTDAGKLIGATYDTNWNETVVSSANPPVVLEIGPAAGANALELSWTSLSNANYTVEEKSDLVVGSWATNTMVSGTGGEVSVLVSTDPLASFFRVLETMLVFNFGFELGTMETWTTNGAAWANQPVTTNLPVANFEGSFHANSLYGTGGEPATGTMKSRSFPLETNQFVSVQVAGWSSDVPGDGSTDYNYVTLKRASDDLELDRIYMPNILLAYADHGNVMLAKSLHHGGVITDEADVYVEVVDDCSNASYAWLAMDDLILLPLDNDNFGFETRDFTGWTVGGRDPVYGLAWQVNGGGPSAGYAGSYYLNSKRDWEESTGTVSSATFTVDTNQFVSVRVGGWSGGLGDGYTDYNYVTLKRASDDLELDRVYAPGKDSMVVRSLFHEQGVATDVYVEVVDDATGGGYAWLAVDDVLVRPLNPGNFDFEYGNLLDWTIGGGTWQVTDAGPSSGFEGQYYANSLLAGEGGTGTVTSLSFTLQEDETVSFQVAGWSAYAGVGDGYTDFNYVTLNRASNGEELDRVYTPGSDSMALRELDPGGATNVPLYVEVVDDATTNAYAWISVDDFQLH